MQRENRRHPGRKILSERSPHPSEIQMPRRGESCSPRTPDSKNAARKFADAEMRRPTEILQLVILKEAVVGAVVQRNEDERDGDSRSNGAMPGSTRTWRRRLPEDSPVAFDLTILHSA